MNPRVAVAITAKNESRAGFQQVVDDARRASGAVKASGASMAGSFRAANSNVGNLAAQFNDIGVQLAGGQSPFLIAMQQGSQITQAIGPMGATGAVKALGSAFLSLISPINLITIGVIALGGTLIQWLVSAQKESKGLTEQLAEQAAPISSLSGRISELQSITDDYAKAIRGTAKDQQIATDSIIANSEREFNAKKSLLDLELKRQRAAIEVQKAELAKAGAELGSQVRSKLLTVKNSEAGGYSDPKVGQFVRSPFDANLLSSTTALLESNPLTDKVKELRANIDLAELSTSTLEDALKTTFSEGVATSVGRIASTAKTGAEKATEKYQDLIRSGEQFIAGQQMQVSTLGMTAEAIARARYEQELFNKAANDNIALLPEQSAQLTGLAAAMAASEEATRRMTDIYDTGKELTNTFFSDLKSNLMSGTSLWGAFADAGAKSLQSIADKALSLAADGVWNLIFGALGSSLFGTGGIGGMKSLPGIGGIGGGLGSTAGAGVLTRKFEGGGYTGSGSRSGGMDGRGGFMAMLHPNETVIDHSRGGGAGGSGGHIAVSVSVGVQNGNIVPLIVQVSGEVAGRKIKQEAPAAVAAARRNGSI